MILMVQVVINILNMKTRCWTEYINLLKCFIQKAQLYGTK